MIIGIDCGYRTGGVALVGDEWAEVHDLPTYDEGGVDVVALMDIITSVDRVDHVFIEKQQAMPKQGEAIKIQARIIPVLPIPALQ